MNLTEINLTVLLAALAFAFVGIAIHWAKKWTRMEIEDGFLEYLFKHNIKHTVAMVIGVLGAVIPSVITGVVDPTTVEGAITVFMAGYMADSVLNKAGKPTGTLR